MIRTNKVPGSRGVDAILSAGAAMAMVVALGLVFLWSPTDIRLGVVQKIFYFHVASAWVAFLAFLVVFVAGIAYLVKRDSSVDHLAAESAGVGLAFTTIVLITGPIWGRSSWNAWWSWEPRLTTTLVLEFIYVGYFAMRSLISERGTRARVSAVFGIVGFLDVPIVFMSIRWWRSRLHPVLFGNGPGRTGGGLDGAMLTTLLVSIAAFSLVYVVLLRRGVALSRLEEKVDNLMATLQYSEEEKE